MPLPFFLRSAESGIGWSRSATGAFLAVRLRSGWMPHGSRFTWMRGVSFVVCSPESMYIAILPRPETREWARPACSPQVWIIIYGQMQSWTPQLVLGPLKQSPPNKWVAALWCGILTVVPLTLGVVMLAGGGWLRPAPQSLQPQAAPTILCLCVRELHSAVLLHVLDVSMHVLNVFAFSCADTFGPGVAQAPAVVAITVVLYAFCLVFAINSAIHSYLIVSYAEGDKASVAACYAASGAPKFGSWHHLSWPLPFLLRRWPRRWACTTPQMQWAGWWARCPLERCTATSAALWWTALGAA